MDKTVVFTVGTALILGFGGGVFKAATLRKSIHREWKDRKYRCVVGLDEWALRTLHRLHAQINRYLEPEREFWPKGPPLDPSILKTLVEDFSRALRWKARIQVDIDRLLKVGPLLVVSFTIGIVAISCVFLSFAWNPQHDAVAIIGYTLLAMSVAALAFLYCMYVVLQHRLANTEIAASEKADPYV